jgi:ribosome-associated protein
MARNSTTEAVEPDAFMARCSARIAVAACVVNRNSVYRAMIRITNDIAIDERDITENFVRASGPGGQNVNKVSSAVELRFDVAASGLPDELKARLRTIAGRQLTAEGILIIQAQEFRSQERNRAAALDRLVALLRRASMRPKRRIATRPTRASRLRRLETKAKRSSLKSQRRSKPSFD